MFDKAMANDRLPHCDSLDGLLLVLERLGTTLEKLKGNDQAQVLEDTYQRVQSVAEQLSRIMLDTNQPIENRLAAARTLSRVEKYRATAIQQLAAALTPSVPPTLQSMHCRYSVNPPMRQFLLNLPRLGIL